ncbi:MAG: hypothetical protein FWC73_02975 [Defluviitaleaceae bacterium]|nr:hypothetical protein [Defluviitaleaceae bacterium]
MMHNESLYHYYYNHGYLGICNGDYERGLRYLLKAYELTSEHVNLLPEDDERLYYHLGLCYTYMEIPYKAIAFVQRAQQVCPGDRIPNLSLNLNRLLALNYVNSNQLLDAKKPLEQCLIDGESIKDDIFISNTMFCFGCMYKKTENWKIAIEYFNSALNCSSKNTFSYFSALYNKIYCIIQIRTFSRARDLLIEAKAMCKTDLLWKTYFEALQRYLVISERMSLSNEEDSDYIEKSALPHFYRNYDYFLAIDYCRLLERHYENLRSTKKSLLMSKEILKIYERCLINHGGDIKK